MKESGRDEIEKIERLVIRIQDRLYENRDGKENYVSKEDEALTSITGVSTENRYGKILWRLGWIVDAVGKTTYGRKE